MSAVAIQCLSSSASDATRLASRLGVAVHEIALHRFPDGELRVTVGLSSTTTIIYTSLDHPNDKLIALLFAAEALRREGCKRLILVAPYLCYMRQDAAFQKGEAISQKAIGSLLAGLFDRIITVDAHLHRTADILNVFPTIAADNLSAMPAIAESLRSAGFDRSTIIVGPDAESRPWVSDLAGRLGLDHAVAQKSRRGDRSVEIGFAEPQSLAGRPIIMVDDIVSSGGTLIACAKQLMAAGATTIDAIVTHALFPVELVNDFACAGIRSVRSTHSIPHPTNAITLDTLFAEALHAELDNAIQREMPS